MSYFIIYKTCEREYTSRVIAVINNFFFKLNIGYDIAFGLLSIKQQSHVVTGLLSFFISSIPSSHFYQPFIIHTQVYATQSKIEMDGNRTVKRNNGPNHFDSYLPCCSYLQREMWRVCMLNRILKFMQNLRNENKKKFKIALKRIYTKKRRMLFVVFRHTQIISLIFLLLLMCCCFCEILILYINRYQSIQKLLTFKKKIFF